MGSRRRLWNLRELSSPLQTAILVCLVAMLSYLVPKLAGELLFHPQTVWPLWPGNALLVSVLLLVPRRIWPLVIPVAFAAFLLYDLEVGVPIGSILWFIPANTVEVLTTALCLGHFFDGVPRLNNVKALGTYSFFAVLVAPFAAAFLGAFGIQGNYWTSWRICFFSEVLAFVTVTPAILVWVGDGPAWFRKSREYHLEFAALLGGLAVLGYVAFSAVGSSTSPATLYSLVPFLLWAALQFGSIGVSTSVIVLTILAVWHTVRGGGPFGDGGPFRSVLSIQLFLVCAATPFMVLAALVEHRKQAEEELRRGAERLRLAMEAGKLGGWEWDLKTRRNPWFGSAHALLGLNSADRSGSIKDFWEHVHPEHHEQLHQAAETVKRNREEYDQEFRVVWPDGTLHWLRSRGRFFYGPGGEPERMLGVSVDITEHKSAEQASRRSEAELKEAQRLAKVGSWQWDPETDTVSWSEELFRIAGLDPNTSAISYKAHSRLFSPESWERLQHAVEEALRAKTPYEIDLEVVCPDSTTKWVIARGEVQCDAAGRVVQLRGTVQDITERKRTEDALRESEAWLSMAVRAGGMYAFEWDSATDVIVRTGECESIFNWMDDPTRVNGQDFIAGMHPDDREAYGALLAGLGPENPIYQASYRLLRPDGSTVWLEASGRAYFDSEGKRLRIIGMVFDVTARKLAEEALASVSRRLIEAQDQERAHIARELHDDLSQQMALLQIGLEQLEQDASELSAQDREHLHKIAELATEVSSNLRDLSHRLHPSKLDTLGLLPCLGSFCKEFGKQHNLQLQFVHQGISEPVPGELSLCLFRIVQESLRNVVKHSGATAAKIELSSSGDRIDLCISDSGTGFSPEAGKTEIGLGLVSMRERLRLVGGQLGIESKPSHGTRIYVSVPVVTKDGMASRGKADKARA